MSAAIPVERVARVAIQAARKAGVLLAAHVGAPSTVHTKRNPADLVTEIDRASERLIARIVKRAFPDHGFYGEEHARRRLDSPYRWYVDPIDGTTNFVHGLPLFAISIGLAYRQAMLVGVIYDPIRRELFLAMKGRGAFLNGRRLRVSRTRSVARSLLATGFPNEFRRQPQPYLGWFLTLEARSRAVRRLGSTAISLAYVAAGRLEGFYEQQLWPWDIAAGLLLVQEAGGRVTDFSGGAPVLHDGKLVASNGRIHAELLRCLRT